MLRETTCLSCVWRSSFVCYRCLLLVGGRSPNANPSTTVGSNCTALTLNTGQDQVGPSDLQLLDTQGRVFCGGIQRKDFVGPKVSVFPGKPLLRISSSCASRLPPRKGPATWWRAPRIWPRASGKRSTPSKAVDVTKSSKSQLPSRLKLI